MKLCRFKTSDSTAKPGLLLEADQAILDLAAAGYADLTALLERDDVIEKLAALVPERLPKHRLADVSLLPPVDRQEVWAAGVTYLRSKAARMEESDFSASAYDRVYAAARPELFFKSLAHKVAGPGTTVGIRQDARWNVPEPELALVINSRGGIVGYTIGNDMSSRDIEGENLLYLPQAKIYTRSCALGPCIRVGVSEAEARAWKINLEIRRQNEIVFAGETNVGQIKRSFDELAGFLYRSQLFTDGAVLLTGTGVIPPETFTLQAGDQVRIDISGLGTLNNTVAEV